MGKPLIGLFPRGESLPTSLESLRDHGGVRRVHIEDFGVGKPWFSQLELMFKA